MCSKTLRKSSRYSHVLDFLNFRKKYWFSARANASLRVTLVLSENVTDSYEKGSFCCLSLCLFHFFDATKFVHFSIDSVNFLLAWPIYWQKKNIFYYGQYLWVILQAIWMIETFMYRAPIMSLVMKDFWGKGFYLITIYFMWEETSHCNVLPSCAIFLPTNSSINIVRRLNIVSVIKISSVI